MLQPYIGQHSLTYKIKVEFNKLERLVSVKL